MINDSLLTQNDVGQIGLKTLKENREVITNRWAETGLLEGLAGNVKENVAMLFENQLSHIMTESTDSASSGSYETVAFPVIRRIFSKLLANDIVSVQALNLPIGLLYYLNPTISKRKSDLSHYAPDGAYNNAAEQAANNLTQFEEKSLYDSYYATEYDDEGTSLYDRSKGAVTTITGSVIPTSYDGGFVTAIVSGFSVSVTADRGTIIGPQGNVLDTEEFLSSMNVTTVSALTATGVTGEDIAAGGKVAFSVSPQVYGRAIVNNNNQLEIIIDARYAGLIDSSGVEGFRPFTNYASAAFEYSFRDYSDLEEDSEMAEVSFGLDKVTVSVGSRKMKAQWTPELSQDISAFHNIDAEAELTALLSEQMAAEIDREILRDLRRGAAWTLRWDYNGLRKQSNQYFGTQKDWNQTLVTKINQLSAQIKKSTLRGGASWIVVSPEISAVLDDLTYFQVSDASAESYQYNLGIEKVGTLAGRYQVYVDPYAPASTMLVGHRGSSILEAGYIYAPYVPMVLTPILYNYTNFSSVRGIYSRYAKKMIFNRYYGTIRCSGLQYFDMNLS